jgi:RNA recognition motif-containing protein
MQDNDKVPLQIRGQKVQVKYALTKEQSRAKLEEEKKKKLFCLGLDPNITKKDLQVNFQLYGEIEEVRLIHEKKKNDKEKMFGFVLFKEPESLQKALKNARVEIVKKEKPEEIDMDYPEELLMDKINIHDVILENGDKTEIQIKRVLLREELKK